MIKEIPVLFNTEMVAALQANRKTETRRTRGLELINDCADKWEIIQVGINRKKEKLSVLFKHKHCDVTHNILCPYGLAGNKIWIRETVANRMSFEDSKHILYKDGSVMYENGEYAHEKFSPEIILNHLKKWTPSIHMHKKYARIWLEIEDIKIERLQDITLDGARAEGIYYEWDGNCHWYSNYLDKNNSVPSMFKNPIESFKSLWGKVNGIREWKRNPYVWVIKFKRIKTT